MSEFEDDRTYTQHICVEHQRLNRLLLDARHLLDQWRAAGDTRTPRPVVMQLRAVEEELLRHLAEEEEEGCLEEALCRCPTLTEEGNHLLHEHAELRRDVQQLRQMAERGEEGGINLTQFVKQFEKCCERLQQHEAEESRIVRQAFSVSLDTDYGNGLH